MTTFAMPENKDTIGKRKLDWLADLYQEYCKTLVSTETVKVDLNHHYTNSSKKSFPAVLTDDPSSLLEQCNKYIQYVYQNELTSDFLTQTLSDLDFIIWNQSNDKCRNFNQQFSCSMLGELHCQKTPLDNLVFPYVLYRIPGLDTEYHSFPRRIDDSFNKRSHDLSLTPTHDIVVVADSTNKLSTRAYTAIKSNSTVKIVRSSCHWSLKRLGTSCPAFRNSPTRGTLSTSQIEKYKRMRAG
jgi:hypothetical protein